MGVVGEERELRALVERARRSDPDAWEAIYVRSYSRLFDYAMRRVRSRDEADDAVSETFARAYVAIGRFRWRGSGFDAWLYGILRNVLLEAFRTRRHHEPDVGDRPSDEPEPLERVIAHEEARAVWTAFMRLRPDERELLELRVVGELDARDVGSVIGKRPGAVRMAQSRAIERLRSYMLGEPER